jgi:hypothetical protein
MPCTHCDATNATSVCAKCKRVHYCSRPCQVADWKHHRTICLNDEQLYARVNNFLQKINGNINLFIRHNGPVEITIEENILDFLQNDFHFVHLKKSTMVTIGGSSCMVYFKDYRGLFIIKERLVDGNSPGEEWTIYVEGN